MTCNNKTSHSIAKPCFFGETEADIKVTKILDFNSQKNPQTFTLYTIQDNNINREKYYVHCLGARGGE